MSRHRAGLAKERLDPVGHEPRVGAAAAGAFEDQRRQAPAAPEAAVQYQGEGAFVYRVARGENGSTAQRVEVQTGAVENGFVEILSGVEPGERIVGSGLNRIQPGAPVSVAGAQRKSGAAQ